MNVIPVCKGDVKPNLSLINKVSRHMATAALGAGLLLSTASGIKAQEPKTDYFQKEETELYTPENNFPIIDKADDEVTGPVEEEKNSPGLLDFVIGALVAGYLGLTVAALVSEKDWGGSSVDWVNDPFFNGSL